MHDVHEFLRSLTIVLGIAALTTVLFQRLRQPVVLGYIIAGLLIGPHVPFPLVANGDIVRTLSELGVILLMFSLGLEFSLSRLVRVGPTAGVTAIIQSFLVAWLGFLMGRLFGWSVLESVFVGAMIATSSTTIIAKAFDEQGIGGRLRELVVGVLLLEDLIAVVFLAALTAIATGAGLSPAALLPTIGRLTAFLLALVAVGILLVPASSVSWSGSDGKRPHWWRVSVSASPRRTSPRRRATRLPSVLSSPDRWWPSRGTAKPSSIWWNRCVTFSWRSSSFQSAC